MKRTASTSGMILLALSGLFIDGCGQLAERSTAPKVASKVRSAAATKADEEFWLTFHTGRYDHLASAIETETRAYLADPHDDLTAAHVGWLHMWRLGERAREVSPSATSVDDAFLARRYFEEATALNPAEPRYQGFLAAATLADGAINQNDRVTVHGYFQMKEGIAAWPEFNLFTGGYVLSSQPATSKRYAEALEWMWQNIDVCIDSHLNRDNPDMHSYMHLEVRTGHKRACWNSWIAPHNFEGFFLSIGDMLVKAGKVDAGRVAYANARLSATYAQWPYREVLETRISTAQDNVPAFSAPPGDPKRRPIMVESSFACMGCHQQDDPPHEPMP
jgi:hypothetical protein